MRIIPAYAGSTFSARVLSSRATDHPRIRGEHIIGSIGMVIGWGSSPHTRGALATVGLEFEVSRIIPAYAGSTSASGTKTRTRSDHPRIRGEHVVVSGRRNPSTGSSPHTRGARPLPRPRGVERRIIPAYAGSTFRGQLIR